MLLRFYKNDAYDAFSTFKINTGVQELTMLRKNKKYKHDS